MPLVFDRAGLKEVDVQATKAFGIPILTLMENAGRCVADAVRHALRPGSRVLIICGSGHNGGDGLVAARHLHNVGVEVTVQLATSRGSLREAAAAQLFTVDAMKIPVEEITPGHAELRDWIVDGTLTDIIVDGIFGVGLSRPVDGLAKETIEAINRSGRRTISIDIPSGLDCDSGQPLGAAIKASETISFCGLKKGFDAGKSYLGKVIVADIGVPTTLLRELAMKSR